MRVISPERAIEDYITAHNMTSFLNEDLLNHVELFHFPVFSNVYIEQDEQHYLYFLVEGQVQCNHYHLNGKLAVFALSDPFTAIGDMEILTDQPVRSNVIATRDTTMLGIANPIVERFGANDPRFLRFLIDQLREKLYKTNTLQINQILPVISRLAVFMLSQRPANKAGAIVLPSKEELASLMGTTPRHLNRVLKEMMESGAISSGYPLVQILNHSTLHEWMTM